MYVSDITMLHYKDMTVALMTMTLFYDNELMMYDCDIYNSDLDIC